ncbi:hypothetical protein IWW50_001490, partial [Coemansia erecta]
MAAIATSHAIGHVRGLLQRLQLADKQLMLAVSGGADSMALAYIVSRAAGAKNCCAVTVDHGFRPESGQEAAAVGRYMQKLGIRHEIRRLEWDATQLPPVQRLEEVFRQRRYAELDNACQMYKSVAVLTGHHAGDQAETFLFRFMRNSGVHGLAGMTLQAPLPFVRPESDSPTPVLVRPLLDFDKRRLYDICKAIGIEWFEDASNKDTRFKRNELRQIIGEADGNDASPFNARSLLKVCKAMQGHRKVINRRLESLLAGSVTVRTDLGVAELASRADGGLLPCWAANPALRERVLASVVGWVNCKDHPPELAHLRQFEQTIVGFYNAQRSGSSAAQVSVTTAGVTMLPPTAGHGWLFSRQNPRAGEIKPREDLALGTTVLWDGRLKVSVRQKPGCSVSEAVTWSIYSLHAAMQQSADQISKHRCVLRKTQRPVDALQAVQVSQPVISVKPVAAAADAQPSLVFALGSPVAGSLATTGVDVTIRALRGANLMPADERQ